jgi:hypothetical protein
MKQCKKKQPNETVIALRREETAHKREYLSYKRPENEKVRISSCFTAFPP